MDVFVIVMSWVLLGVATGWVAQSKGRNFFGWWLLGTVLPIIGLILAVAVRKIEANIDQRELSRGERKKCPYCAELIRPEAQVCRFCGRNLTRTTPSTSGDIGLTVLDADTIASMQASQIQNRHN